MSITKRLDDLCVYVKKDTGYSKKLIKQIWKSGIKFIIFEIAQDNKVGLVNLGSFDRKEVPVSDFNPLTGATFVPDKLIKFAMRFKPSTKNKDL